MEWLKLNENSDIIFNSEEVKLVPEIQNLLTMKYNKQEGDGDGRKKYRALNELKYLYLMYSFRSPYRDYSDEERLAESKLDCGFGPDWEESTELKLLIPKFVKGTQSKLARLLSTTEKVLDKLDRYYNSINLEERNDKGDYVNDPKKIMDSLKQLPGLAATLQQLEQQVKLGHVGTPKSKGDHELGWMAVDDVTKKQQRDDNEYNEED